MKTKNLWKLVLLILLGVSVNVSAQTQEKEDYPYFWWHYLDGHTRADWKDIDHQVVWQCIKDDCPNKGQVRMGSTFMYLEVLGDYHHVYINELKVKVHFRPEPNTSSYSYIGTYFTRNSTNEPKGLHRIRTIGHICETASFSCSHSNKTLSDGDTLTLKSIREYINIKDEYYYSNTSSSTWSQPPSQGLDYVTHIGNYNMAYWANITHSTSENYHNYLTNHPDELQRETKYFEVDEHGDGTYLLHPSWLCNHHQSYQDNIETNEHVKHNVLNWHGEHTNVFEFDNTDELTINGSPRLGGYQEIELEYPGVYTVQAIVRGNAGHSVTLHLTGKDGAESTSTQEVYGMEDNSTSTVNTFGRVDYWDKGTNAGWTKVEAVVEVAAGGKLKIELYSDDNNAHFQVSDLTLLLNANDPDNFESFWTTAGLDENTTYMDMTTIENYTWYDAYYKKYLNIKFPHYNKFSFFDRGTNKNGIVYAHPRTAIGMYAGMADGQDHVHECNIAVPYANPNADYIYDDNALDFDNIHCKKLILSDNGTNNTSPHAFGIPMAIKAKEVSYERQYKAGQMSTAVFPFALDATQLDDFFGVEKVHKFKSIDVENQTLTFEDKTSTTANEPFMFKPTKAGKIAFAAEGDGYIDISNTLDETTKEPLTIATSGQNANGGTATFQGIYEQKIWGADYIINEDNNPVYMFNAAKESGQFSILAKNKQARCKPFRAYMEVTKGVVNPLNMTRPSAYKVIYIDGNDSEVTGINGIVDNAAPTTNAIYTIDGRYVSTDVNVLERGIYIINGKKVIIK